MPYYLSTMLGSRIEDEDGTKVGRLSDIVAGSSGRFPVVRGIISRSGPWYRRRLFYVPWSAVKSWSSDRFVVDGASFDVEGPWHDDILLQRDLLDKQIVDLDGYKIVRVSDLRLSRSGDELRVLGADISGLAILRRLLPDFIAVRLGGAWLGLSERLIPWHLVSPVDPMPADVRLTIPYRGYRSVHPSDIADIIEQLDVQQRKKVLALIDDPKAAEVLAQLIPGVRTSVAESIGEERLSDLLEIMPPDEAADILGSLPRGKAQALLSLMGIEEASVVGELLGYDPETAGGRMTTQFVSVPKKTTAQETVERLRRIGYGAEIIYYVYVVDDEGHLSGVLSLRDLLRAAPDVAVERIMIRDVITVDLMDDQEEVAERLSRYNLLALPVTDDDHVLKGIVTVDDAIDVLMEEASEDLSQLSGVSLEEEGRPLAEAFDPRRLGGTLLTFLGGILGVALFGAFRSDFVASLALVFFVPIALRASHDVSVWSLATAVSEFGEQELETARLRKVLVREYINTVFAAFAISALSYPLGLIWTGGHGPAFAAAAGLFIGINLAGLLGILLPLFIRKVRPDPAIGFGRIVGVSVMAVSIVSFLLVSGLLVRAFN